MRVLEVRQLELHHDDGVGDDGGLGREEVGLINPEHGHRPKGFRVVKSLQQLPRLDHGFLIIGILIKF